MFGAFQKIEIGYRDATYHIVPATGALGVFWNMGVELCKRRMPPSRVWNLFYTNGKCVGVTQGITVPDEQARPYEEYMVRQLAMTPRAGATADQVQAGAERALLHFGNKGLSSAEPDPKLVLVQGETRTEMPSEPRARYAALTNLLSPGRK